MIVIISIVRVEEEVIVVVKMEAEVLTKVGMILMALLGPGHTVTLGMRML
jgi:hypothetical protein